MQDLDFQDASKIIRRPFVTGVEARRLSRGRPLPTVILGAGDAIHQAHQDAFGKAIPTNSKPTLETWSMSSGSNAYHARRPLRCPSSRRSGATSACGRS